MQKGSLIRRTRQNTPDVWEFRWREPGPDGIKCHRRIVVGSADDIGEKSAARRAVAALQLEINIDDVRYRHSSLTIFDLFEHFLQRELKPESGWRTFSTRHAYEGYLKKWIVPRWGSRRADSLTAGEVELWLRSLPLARASCAKIRNLMSILFNHGIRHGICAANPIRLVRQSAKRKKVPFALPADQIHRLLTALPFREKTLVLLAAGTGLRMSELFALKWGDVHFETGEIDVVRSIVLQVVGPCKTEVSQRPIPMDPCLAEALQMWQVKTRYRSLGDWVFASGQMRGRKPYWGQPLMRNIIRPAAIKLGINRRIGWHTFRHSYSTLLRATGADVKVMQELLRHASSRMTLDTYTHVVTDAKRKAQSEVVKLLVSPAQDAG
jgi:integrase